MYSNSSANSSSAGGPHEEGPFFCKWRGCAASNRVFSNGADIWQHLVDTHLVQPARQDDKYQCCWEECVLERRNLFCLKSHMKKHLDWRPYGCSYCFEWFKHRCDHKKHVSTSKLYHPQSVEMEGNVAMLHVRCAGASAHPTPTTIWLDGVVPMEKPFAHPPPMLPSPSPSLHPQQAPAPLPSAGKAEEELHIWRILSDMLHGGAHVHATHGFAERIYYLQEHTEALVAVVQRLDDATLHQLDAIYHSLAADLACVRPQ
ncbi:hypothetical protein THASP1DRAFT_32314 [Thamnocephalis sphaerospora]|uniref:C2H2-type domain-containing protein n=1 Tax=Thamnocephalis sphaerospora TaxID=78915 RepID=A0A4P9XJC6_9FUNG|nr:hypothetical protein THASP1DRAFT_32314 [Thamnocephalis sphaerospora]|eukprot:RKP05857.1 hypothetical protein THASP1DRAFT_32314 [Thamnocephalis sphaerospora]